VTQLRTDVDQKEPVADGSRPQGNDREWVGYAQQAKTGVPESFGVFHSPKQRQDEEM
jgi:hypothetical protein